MNKLNKLLIFTIMAYIVISAIYGWYVLVKPAPTQPSITTQSFKDFRDNSANLDFARKPLANPSPELNQGQ